MFVQLSQKMLSEGKQLPLSQERPQGNLGFYNDWLSIHFNKGGVGVCGNKEAGTLHIPENNVEHYSCM